jgi:ribosome-associated protein
MKLTSKIKRMTRPFKHAKINFLLINQVKQKIKTFSGFSVALNNTNGSRRTDAPNGSRGTDAPTIDSRDEPASKNDLDWFENTLLNPPENISFLDTPRWLKGKEMLEKRKIERDMEKDGEAVQSKSGPLLVSEIFDELKYHAAMDIKVIDVSQKVDHVETVVICHGRSARHVYSIADSIRILAKNRYVRGPFMPDTLSIEGKDSQDWLLLDLGHVMVHVFTPQGRADIDLDSLWQDEDQEPEK